MDRQLKQRVVGAAVLVMVGGIFIPLFLDNSSVERELPEVPSIPPLPQTNFSSRVVPLSESDIDALEQRSRANVTPPRPPESVPEPAPLNSDTDVTKAQSAAMATDSTPAAEPSMEKITVPSPRAGVAAWTVQLGSFANDANAKRLIEKLRADGYPAYLQRQAGADATEFKVRVGPQIRRDEAEKVLLQLQQKFALKGMLLRYQ